MVAAIRGRGRATDQSIPVPADSSVADTNNRIRQARRFAKLSQAELATRVGVHRSAVAQWEAPAGSRPTVDNLARIALSTGVQFEWLATGRGRMKYASDIVPSDETPALLLEHSAQSEAEVRGLVAMRLLDFKTMLAILELMESLGKTQQLRFKRKTPYSR